MIDPATTQGDRESWLREYERRKEELIEAARALSLAVDYTPHGDAALAEMRAAERALDEWVTDATPAPAPQGGEG